MKVPHFFRPRTGVSLWGAAAAAAVAVCLSAPRPATAAIDLGTAGPNYFTVLSLGGKVDLSNPSGYVNGTVGIAAPGSLQSSGPDINGTIFIQSGVTVGTSGSAQISGGVVTDNARIQLAVQDAINRSAFYASQMGTAVTITGNNQTITGSSALNVFNLTDLNISGGKQLTLSAPAGSQVVLNITGGFNLTGGSDILLSGGLTPSDVLYNVLGSGGQVALNGGGGNGIPEAQISGILLSPQRKIALAPGFVNGSVIGGGGISIVSGAKIQGVKGIPEPGTVALLLMGGLPLCLAIFRRPGKKVAGY